MNPNEVLDYLERADRVFARYNIDPYFRAQPGGLALFFAGTLGLFSSAFLMLSHGLHNAALWTARYSYLLSAEVELRYWRTRK